MSSQGTEIIDNPFLTLIREIVDAAGVRHQFETEKQFHLKLRQPSHDPLVIQSIPPEYPYLGEQRLIIVSHMIVVPGAKLALPNVIMTDQGVPIEVQTLTRYWKIVSQGLSQITEIDESRLAEAQVFLQAWTIELREEGWITIAQARRRTSSTDELIP